MANIANDFLFELQAALNVVSSIKNIDKDIDKIKDQVKQLQIQAKLDPNTAQGLAKELEKVIGQKIVISNIGVDTSSAVKSAQQTGKQIGNAINQGVTNSVSKANNTLKSFSELKIGTGNIDAILDKDGVLDIEQSLIKIKQIYSEFGQVRITNKLFDPEGNLQKFRVEIQQVNGDLKESRSFMMALTDSGKSFGFPEDVIRGSENYVHHLNDTKKVTNEVLTEEQKLANVMGDVREKSEQIRQAEEKRQQLAQNKASNKALEDEYKQKQKLADQVNEIQLSLDNGSYESQILSYETALQKLGLASKEVADKMENVSTAYAELKTSASGENIIPDDVITKAATLETEMSKLNNTVKQIKLKDSLKADDLQVEQTIIRLNKQLTDNGKYTKETKTKIREMLAELEKGNIAAARLKQINVEAKELHSNMAAIDKTGQGFFDRIGSKINSLGTYLSAAAIISKALMSAKNGISAVKELDTALVDLKKTAKMSAKELENFYLSANDTAKQMGVTTKEIIEQAAAWSRLNKIGPLYGDI